VTVGPSSKATVSAIEFENSNPLCEIFEAQPKVRAGVSRAIGALETGLEYPKVQLFTLRKGEGGWPNPCGHTAGLEDGSDQVKRAKG
jgi:hypothetical protein